MVNFNGDIVEEVTQSLAKNRAFLYGDGVFETLKVLDGKVLFLEDHYFRLMSGMRIVRMEIPMNFTMEYFEEQMLVTAKANDCVDSARVRINVFRDSNGYYLPESNTIGYLITSERISEQPYQINELPYEVDLFKDFYVSKQLLSSVKTTNKIINVTGSIFALENGLQNCLLTNDEKNVIEALQGNLFMLTGNKLVTPPVTDGCLNGVMRKQIIAMVKKMEGFEMAEESISPFDLQKADELFITNVIKGIQPITKYRKKEFGFDFAQKLLINLNASIRLG